jgi:hypothetical protein
MKLALIGIIFMLFAFFSTLSHANERPLLGKYNYPGMLPEDADYMIEQCEAFVNGHIIKSTIHVHNRNKEVGTETFPLPVPVEQLREWIKITAHEQMMMSPNYLCDGPSTVMSAYGPKDMGEKGVLTLFSTGGCGVKRIMREGPASRKLQEILDLHCPLTIDINE